MKISIKAIVDGRHEAQPGRRAGRNMMVVFATPSGTSRRTDAASGPLVESFKKTRSASSRPVGWINDGLVRGTLPGEESA